ncbi:YbfB/YjiJ family MFS transporter [Roseibium sp.]|uniref:YbfB/YjiJ family MFS transporter n=1 Tax=Roseibium sp. TaxID=1936156 RepID=UPI0032998CF7
MRPSPASVGLLQIGALALAPATALGITRFAYALLLPDMRSDLGLTYSAAGWLNTTNAIGYLVGALLAARSIERLGAKKTAIMGVVLCLVSLAACALIRDQFALNGARLLGGLGGGFAYIGAALAATEIATRHPRREALLLALLYAGPGLGIVASGISLPFLLEGLGAGSWPWGWVLQLAIALPMSMLLPLGFREADPGKSARHRVVRLGPIAPMLVGYCLFGAGYIGYMTFMIAFVRDGGGGALEQATFWSTIGIAAALSPLIWFDVIRRAKGGRAFALIGIVTTIGALLPLVIHDTAARYVSAALFGCSFFSVVASTTSYVRNNLDREDWSGAIASMTASFGFGQIAGPVLSGYLSDAFGGLDTGLMFSVGLLLSGAVLGSRQPALKR